MLENLTDLLQERQLDLAQMRQEIAKELPNLPMPDDIWLLRFLVHTTLRKALPRVKAMMLFRKQHKLDEIAARIESENMQPIDFPHFHEMAKCCPQTILFGFARDSTPYGIEMHGLNNLSLLLETLTYEQFYLFNMYKLEYIRLLVHKLTLRTGKLVRFHVVADLKGLGMKHANPSFLKWFKAVCSDSQNHFREMVGRVFCVNSNAPFFFIWKILKPALSEKTLEKVSLLQTDFRDLYSFINPAQLPICLGGTQPNDYMHEFDMHDTHPDTTHAMRESRSLVPFPTAPAVEEQSAPLSSAVTRSLADFRASLVRERTLGGDSDSDDNNFTDTEACDSTQTGPRLVDVFCATPIPSPPMPLKYSSDDRVNQQISSSGGVFAVTRQGTSNGLVDIEMGSIDDRLTNVSRTFSSHDAEKSISQSSSTNELDYDKKLKYLDYMYGIWVVVFVGLLVNSGAVSTDLRLKVSIPLPILVSVVLWSLILLTPLLMRFAFRRFANQQQMHSHGQTLQTLKDLEQQHREQQARFHASMSHLLRDLCNDVSDLETSLLRSRTPTFSVKRTQHNPGFVSLDGQKDELSQRSPVDALIHCAGVVRGKSSIALAVPSRVNRFKSNEVDQQYAEMRKEVETIVALVRSHLSNFALSSAVMWRQLDQARNDSISA